MAKRDSGGGPSLRQTTADKIAAIKKLLHAGKSPKEVAWQMNAILKIETSYDDVKQLICRHRELHKIYVETYPKRNPHKATPPPKLIISYLASQG